MKKGKKRHIKEEKGRSFIDKVIDQEKKKSEKVLEEFSEWMKPGTWIVTPGSEYSKSEKYQLKESDFPLWANRTGSTLFHMIFTNGGWKTLYTGKAKAKPDTTVRKKFTEWLNQGSNQETNNMSIDCP